MTLSTGASQKNRMSSAQDVKRWGQRTSNELSWSFMPRDSRSPVDIQDDYLSSRRSMADVLCQHRRQHSRLCPHYVPPILALFLHQLLAPFVISLLQNSRSPQKQLLTSWTGSSRESLSILSKFLRVCFTKWSASCNVKLFIGQYWRCAMHSISMPGHLLWECLPQEILPPRTQDFSAAGQSMFL